MRVLVKKWGKSASVRVPASVMAAAKLTLDAVVDVREEGGRVVIEPLRDSEYDVDALVGRITSENLHSESGFGAPRGKESF
jgi:antitoxin MazE